MYFAGDGAKRDEDGYLWLLGRVDDVMNVAGHRISHDRGRVGAGRPPVGRRGRGRRQDRRRSPARRSSRSSSSRPARSRPTRWRVQLREHVAYVIGPIARPKFLMFVPGPAQDPLGQDHAPPAARHRRGPDAGRHDDARRRDRGRDDPRRTPARPRRSDRVPFGFLTPQGGRRPATAAGTGGGVDGGRAAAARAASPFDGADRGVAAASAGCTIAGRLSDALNKREAIAIRDVSWAPIDGCAPLAPAPGLQERRPVRPDPRHRRRGLAAAADRRRADRAQGPQGRLRRGPRGAAVPGHRDGLPPPGLRAGPAARPVDRDVRAGRRRGRAAWATARSRTPSVDVDPRQPLLPARRGAGRQADRRAAPEAARRARWAASAGRTAAASADTHHARRRRA